MQIFLALLLVSMVPANAQFHITNALNLQSQALAAEEAARLAAVNAWKISMQFAVDAMEESEDQKAYVYALERGEPFAPDGTPIPENQNFGIRPLDPRTPIDFGDPFARINSVQSSIDSRIADAKLSTDQLAMLESITESISDGNPVVFDDVHNTMVYLKVPPRNMCGVSMEHAEDTCGPTCDADHDFCIMGHVSGVEGFINTMNAGTGQYENWGICYPDVVCQNPDHHEVILDDPDGCHPHMVHNPCPNPCDCLKEETKQAECHSYCQLTDTFAVIQCMLLRNRGQNMREMKVATAIGAQTACEYNVFYEHPLMSAEVLETQSVPGLFGTF